MVAIGRMSPRGARNGFTIVELLIVIVVIAILAAVSFVAYSGIQNEAADSAVRSDLSQAGRKAMAAIAKEELQDAYNHAAEIDEVMNTMYSLSSAGYSTSERYPIIALFDQNKWRRNPDTGGVSYI